MKKTARIFSLIAAICFFICAIFVLIDLCIDLEMEFTTLLDYIGTVSSMTAMAVTLVIKNKKAVMVAAIISAVLSFVTVSDISFSFGVLAYVGVIALIVLSLKRNKIVKKIWFVPAATMFLIDNIPLITSIIPVLAYVLAYGYGGISIILVIVPEIVSIVALLFVGMWIKEDTVIVSSIIDEADKLKMYKRLLESGKITQEKFDKQKKKILGLPQDQPSRTVHHAAENTAMMAQKQVGVNSQETRKGDFWICSGCGTTNDNSGAFCSNCGKGK